jgi:phage tail-like protein
MPRSGYPPVSFHFKVEIAGFEGEAGFQSVDGLNVTIPDFAYAEGGENTFTHRFPNRIAFTDLTLKRGMLIGSPLIKWFKDAAQLFLFEPRNVTVTLMTAEHTPLEQWHFRNAWPKAWNVESFDSTGSKVAVESIVLAYQYFTREGLPARDQSLIP